MLKAHSFSMACSYSGCVSDRCSLQIAAAEHASSQQLSLSCVTRQRRRKVQWREQSPWSLHSEGIASCRDSWRSVLECTLLWHTLCFASSWLSVQFFRCLRACTPSGCLLSSSTLTGWTYAEMNRGLYLRGPCYLRAHWDWASVYLEAYLLLKMSDVPIRRRNSQKNAH